MEISTSSNIVTIIGNIKSMSDFQLIYSTIDRLKATHKSIILEIKDSISITSSIVGYLNKLVLKDMIDLHIKVGNEQLMALFDELNLSAVFKTTKV